MKPKEGYKFNQIQINIKKYRRLKELAIRSDLTITEIFDDMITRAIQTDKYVCLEGDVKFE